MRSKPNARILYHFDLHLSIGFLKFIFILEQKNKKGHERVLFYYSSYIKLRSFLCSTNLDVWPFSVVASCENEPLGDVTKL